NPNGLGHPRAHWKRLLSEKEFCCFGIARSAGPARRGSRTMAPSRRSTMALVVLLRGVNVGGHKTFRPTVLAEQLKAYDVVNIGAAGTFVIRRATSQAKLRADLRRRLPFASEVMICKGHELVGMASGNPFGEAPIPPRVVRFVSVLAK